LERQPDGPGGYSLYPNPTTGRFRLLYNGSLEDMGAATATLTSADGRLVVQHPLAGISTQFDLTVLPAGSYWLSVADAVGWVQRLPIILID
jgi:hypothetical protein